MWPIVNSMAANYSLHSYFFYYAHIDPHNLGEVRSVVITMSQILAAHLKVRYQDLTKEL